MCIRDRVDGSSIEISSNALQVKASGISANMLAGSIPADKLNLGNGVQDNGSGNLEIDLDGTSLDVGVNGLKVNDGGVTAAMLAGSIAAGKLLLGNGIRDNGSGNLEIDLDGNTLDVGGDGLKVNDGGIGETQLADQAVTPDKCGFFSNWDVLTADGSAVNFDLSETINETFASIIVIRNGLVVKQVMSSPTGQDEFSLSLTGGAGGVSRISFGSAPTNGSDLRVWYMA